MSKKTALLILDGWGIGKKDANDATWVANTPYMDFILSAYPSAQLLTHGENVGLPKGQMGNSEVGHMNIGAGRIVWQMLAKINEDMETKEFDTKPKVKEIIEKAKQKGKLHIMGLISDGGVHSSLHQIVHIANLAAKAGVDKVIIHGFLDGRDTDPKSGKAFISQLLTLVQTNVSIGSLIGRYYAMDRDKRWERTKKAYELLTNELGLKTMDFVNEIETKYTNGITDEFMEPMFNATQNNKIENEDVVLCMNFRTDRCRQLSESFLLPLEEVNKNTPVNIAYYTLTVYDENYKLNGTIYDSDVLTQTLGEQIANANLTQLRAAETEKYPHVTFFFNGGREAIFKGEKRVLVSSPKVATYDLQPEMSAIELTKMVIKEIEMETPNFVCINYANPDMVGHTGVFNAIVKAVETVDSCVKDLTNVLYKNGYEVVIIADHGNAEFAINDDGSPNTAHTTNPVFICVLNKSFKVHNGILADVAPTILTLLELPIDLKMTGKNLISKQSGFVY